MLIGQFSHSLDDKGRLIIPSKFREELGREFVVAKAYDDCLYAYTNAEWEKFVSQYENIDERSKDERDFRRYFIGTASAVEMDRQGRFLIPSYLRDAAGIRDDVMIVGIGRKLEIWSAENWNRFNGPEQMAAIREKVYDDKNAEEHVAK